MASLASTAAAWRIAQANAGASGTTAAAQAAEQARQTLASHPAVEHARRTHGANAIGSRKGVER